MKKLLLLLPTLAIAIAPTGALAQSVFARDLPASRQHEWTKAPPMPFPQTPEGFKAFVNSRDLGMKILKAEKCEYTKYPAKVIYLEALGKDSWTADRDYYSCDRTFYESSDPRGVQRCMGKAWYTTIGTTPEQLSPYSGFHHETLKNDCRWL